MEIPFKKIQLMIYMEWRLNYLMSKIIKCPNLFKFYVYQVSNYNYLRNEVFASYIYYNKKT